jgi:hypothetical protein
MPRRRPGDPEVLAPGRPHSQIVKCLGVRSHSTRSSSRAPRHPGAARKHRRTAAHLSPRWCLMVSPASGFRRFCNLRPNTSCSICPPRSTSPSARSPPTPATRATPTPSSSPSSNSSPTHIPACGCASSATTTPPINQILKLSAPALIGASFGMTSLAWVDRPISETA